MPICFLSDWDLTGLKTRKAGTAAGFLVNFNIIIFN